MDKLRTFPDVEAVGADTHTGCLVLFQEGKVDAITGDDTVLAGWPPRTPTPRSSRRRRSPRSPTASAINQTNVDFVRFVNGVLEKMRADGRWTASYKRWLADALGTAPDAPAPVYGRTP